MLRKFFMKRFRTFAIIMFIPLLLLFIIMGFMNIYSQQEELKKQGVNTLKSINDNIVYVVYSTIHQQDVMMGSAQYKLALQKLLRHDRLEFKDVVFMNAIENFIRSSESSYPYINSVYLYIDGRNNFLTSSSDQLASVDNYYDKDWFNHYKSIPKEDKQFVETRWLKRHSYEEPKKVITIYQRMTYAKGVIVVNVNAKDFGMMIENMLYHSGQNFYYLNKKGDTLFASNPGSASDAAIENGFFTNSIKEYESKGRFSKNQEWVKLGGKYFLIYIEPASYYETYFVSMISFDVFADRLLDFLKLAFAILLINFLIVMALAWITTKTAFKHITYLVDVFSAAERGEIIEKPLLIVKDEYNLIMNNILFLFIKNNQMQTNLMEKQHQNEITEIMALQLQINPHFIFNTLQTMDLEVLKEKGGQSTLHTMIQELSRIIKYALTNPTEPVTLREELDYLKAYLQIQEIRFNHILITYFEIDDEILEHKVFRLMLQPMVENSVNHGMKSTDQHCYIKIKGFIRNDVINIAVIDNGCGMTKEEIAELYIKINDPSSKNIGLTNLNRRLLLHYGDTSKLHIRSKKNLGTGIYFKIPIQNAEVK
ncbi:sensor histidine kinase [Anaerocolumna sp. MB42-C2]|uniref:sensor histidine kinase n=1 Tax=Anaerocolumna sp. MB42-C2 TaxID=3070997 RepID=UPI0027DEADD9|nr:histidine kinase [Anaerocolumna sp. MB42-C2]WMJ87262.1 histidine kinase [Anaerocolumna sp. MB42-C2]